ncbi:hypothetical protein ACI50N_24080, partial [Escherichia coli]
KTSIFSHPVYLFLRGFSLQDSRGGSCTEKIPEENNTISMDLTREAVKMVEEQMTGHKGNIRGTVSTQRELEKKFATAAGKHTARDVLT